MSNKIILEKSELSDGGIIVSKDLDAIKPKCIIIQDDATVKICRKDGKTMIIVDPKEVKEEEPQFKKGDIIFLNVQGNKKIYQHLAIVKSIDKDKGVYFSFSFCINEDKLSAIHKSMWFSKEDIKSIRYATEEEKRTLFLAMLNKGLFWDEIEMKVQELKDGDVILVFIKSDGIIKRWTCIYRDITSTILSCYGGIAPNGYTYTTPGGMFHTYEILSIRLCTEEEKDKMLKTIAKDRNVIWNAETKKFENIIWRAKKDERYWYVDECLTVCQHVDWKDDIDGCLFSVNNYFQTKELAEAAANKIKELLSKL